MVKSTFRLLIGLVLLVTFALSVTAQDDTVPRYEPLDDCFIEMPEDVAYECGNVIVPEFYDGRTENTFSLGVVRLLSTSDDPAEPIFFGAGGPGGSIFELLEVVVLRDIQSSESDGFYIELLANHDLVFFAQRGTAHSDPFLPCYALNELQNNYFAGNYDSWSDLGQARTEALTGCYDEYVAGGLDLSAFTSVASTDDINSIRQVFDYDMILYYGESYGTLLGQHLMREYPEILTAVVLDGALPIGYPSWETELDARYQSALGYLVDLCASDAVCSEDYPNLEEDINAAYQRLQDTPYEVEVGGVAFTVDAPQLSTAIYNAFYTLPSIRNIPHTLNAIANDLPSDQVPGVMVGALPSQGDGNNATGWLTHYAIICSDDPVYSLDDAYSLDSLRFDMISAYVDYDAGDYIAMCEHMDLPVLSDETDTPISSEIPVLVISGGFDPVTPELSALPITETLPNSYAVTIPFGDHVNGPDNACAHSILRQFYADPMTEPDSSCTSDVETFVFFPPASP